MTNYIPYPKSETFTANDIGLVIFQEPSGDPYKYYEGVIKYAFDKFGFEPNEEHIEYPTMMLEQPMIKFDYKVKNPDIYADFVDTWNFLCYQCSPEVTIDFEGGYLDYDGKDGLTVRAKE